MVSKKRDVISMLKPDWKLWLVLDETYVFGPGAYEILQAIHKEGSISEAARAQGMSYRYAWGIIKEIEKKLHLPLLETFRGGQVGGGGARLTENAFRIMEKFDSVKKAFAKVIADQR